MHLHHYVRLLKVILLVACKIDLDLQALLGRLFRQLENHLSMMFIQG